VFALSSSLPPHPSPPIPPPLLPSVPPSAPPPRRIIASIFFVLGAFVHLLVAHAQAALVTITGQARPGLAMWTIFSAWTQLFGTILVLIGSIVFSGGSLGAVGAGAVLHLIGFTMWGIAILIAFGIAFVVSTTVAIMPAYGERIYAWSNIVALVFLLLNVILLNLGAVLLTVRDPPGIWLTAGLLYLIAAVYGTIGWFTATRGSYGYFTPILGYATAAAMTSGALGAGALGAGALGAGAGLGAGAAMAGKPYSSAGVPGTTMGGAAVPGTMAGAVGPTMGATTPGMGMATTPAMATTPGMGGVGTSAATTPTMGGAPMISSAPPATVPQVPV
jgi:hypothetical protein